MKAFKIDVDGVTEMSGEIDDILDPETSWKYNGIDDRHDVVVERGTLSTSLEIEHWRVAACGRGRDVVRPRGMDYGPTPGHMLTVASSPAPLHCGTGRRAAARSRRSAYRGRDIARQAGPASSHIL